MTEKEKCENGLLYDANFDPELLNDRMVCKDLCLEYNQLKNSDLEKRKELIKKIIKNSKENLIIEPNF